MAESLLLVILDLILERLVHDLRLLTVFLEFLEASLTVILLLSPYLGHT